MLDSRRTLPGECVKGAGGPLAGGPPAPPTWLVGDIQPLDVRWAILAIVLVSLLLLILPSCENPPPPPPPPPTPTPGPPIEMLLRARGPQLVTLGGQPVSLLGAIPCCAETSVAEGKPSVRRPLPIHVAGEELLTGWPVAVSPTWRTYVHSFVGDRPVFFHARLGPFFGSNVAEPEWADVGGGYKLVAGKADLTRFNPAYWNRVFDWGLGACLAGDFIEFDLVDRWWSKQCFQNGPPNPMCPEWNIQGYNFATHVGRQAIIPGSPEDAWLEQAVRTVGPLPCVIWQDGNEVGLGGYGVEWTFSMRERVRFHETNVGDGVIHLFGTNSGRAEAESGPVDYIEHHQSMPIPVPLWNKPSFVNEYNPNPPLSADQLHERFCAARLNRTGWWAWRHTMSQVEFERALSLIAHGCAG